MKNRTLKRKLDKLGRITLPSDFRKALKLADLEELVVVSDGNSIILRKQVYPDVFGNIAHDDFYFEYRGNKVSRRSIIELSEIAGII